MQNNYISNVTDRYPSISKLRFNKFLHLIYFFPLDIFLSALFLCFKKEMTPLVKHVTFDLRVMSSSRNIGCRDCLSKLTGGWGTWEAQLVNDLI